MKSSTSSTGDLTRYSCDYHWLICFMLSPAHAPESRARCRGLKCRIISPPLFLCLSFSTFDRDRQSASWYASGHRVPAGQAKQAKRRRRIKALPPLLSSVQVGVSVVFDLSLPRSSPSPSPPLGLPLSSLPLLKLFISPPREQRIACSVLLHPLTI